MPATDEQDVLLRYFLRDDGARSRAATCLSSGWYLGD
jgi:hypothetical protein